mgnify:FL=1
MNVVDARATYRARLTQERISRARKAAAHRESAGYAVMSEQEARESYAYPYLLALQHEQAAAEAAR